MQLYPGTEHLLLPVACGDPFLDIRVACGDALLEAQMNIGRDNWDFTFVVPHSPEVNIFAYSFPVANQHVKVVQFGDMPERKRMVAAFLACGAVHVGYTAPDGQFDFYPEDFDALFYRDKDRVRQSRAAA